MVEQQGVVDSLAIDAVLSYHARSKHRLERYAAGPETLDWDSPPDPFRRFAGAPLLPLPLAADADATTWSSLFTPGAEASRPAGRASLGLLFELSFALSAWKQHGPDRWAVRCTPSSGNLRPMYHWPVIEQVARASRSAGKAGPAGSAATATPTGSAGSANTVPPQLLPRTTARAATLIRQRRSAQGFDRRARLDAARFWPIAAALLPDHGSGNGAAMPPWDARPAPARVHAVLFAHRIDGLAPGAYLLPRAPAALPALQQALPQLAWQRVDGAPAGLPLYRLADNPALAATLRTLSCHQAIGADAIFVVALLAEFCPPLRRQPSAYRALLQEAGLAGQVLYLAAEATGLRGTGIGCFFDDPVHELLGLVGGEAPAWQVLYHFSVGQPLADARIHSEPPYAGRAARPLQESVA